MWPALRCVTLMGPLNSCKRSSSGLNFVHYDDEMLHQQMEWMFRNDLEEPMVDSTIVMSVEDHRALTQMEDSVKIVDGHYQLGLPWKNNFTSLPNDRECALTRLNHLKKHFQHNPDLFERYKVTIKGHVSSGYARLVPHCELEVDEDTPV